MFRFAAACCATIAGTTLIVLSASAATRWTPHNLSTDQYESSPTFTPDGREIFFMSSDKAFGKYRILWSQCRNGEWTKPEPPSFAAPPDVLEADPFVTLDGKRLYFISARKDPTKEDLDIWYVDRKPDGNWSDAQRLPEPVNSSSEELLPRATADGRIYFGSGRKGSQGQNKDKGDIYIATPSSNGKWRVRNAGPPISTPAHEYEAEISRDERTMIVVADRGDRSHLYHFKKHNDRWVEQGRIPARSDVFQVGPLLSPRADRLLFAEAENTDRSGEMFLIDLSANPDTSWPPTCP